jgi:hypothetical protein
MVTSELDLTSLDVSRLSSQRPTGCGDELTASCFRALLREFNPTGFAETMLARDIARRAAQMLRDEQQLDAVRVETQQMLASVLAPTASQVAPADMHLPGLQVCVSERLEALARADLRNSNAFFLRLRQLQELQRDRNPGEISLRDRDQRFANEAQCITYLARRFRLGDQRCRHCGQAGAGSWIAVRRCWQCSTCNTQTCIRHGTVMARSHVPLTCWFHAIQIVLYQPTITAADMAAATGIRRVPTVKSMLSKIHAAMLTDDGSQRLAGLDVIYLPAT